MIHDSIGIAIIMPISFPFCVWRCGGGKLVDIWALWGEGGISSLNIVSSLLGT